MHYTKKPLSFREQANQLVERGLVTQNIKALEDALSRINYYRLSAYWYPFRRIDSTTGEESFAAGTSFDTVIMRYNFDRELRLLAMDAVERIEVAILRTRMVEHFTRIHGPFGYVDPSNFNPSFHFAQHQRMLDDIDEAASRTREEFVHRFFRKYTSENRPPLWMAVEIMTFGQLQSFYRRMHRHEQVQIASSFNLAPKVLESWLHTLNFIRNACAHHARLWNSQIAIRPLIPHEKHHPEWHYPVSFDNRRVFTVLTLMRYLLAFIDPDGDWQKRLLGLFDNYPEISLKDMGFVSNWRDCSIWS